MPAPCQPIRGTVSRRQAHAARLPFRTHHRMQQAGLRLFPGSQGPSRSLLQPDAGCVGGKTHCRFLTAGEAAVAQQQIAAGREFRQQIDTYWEVGEQWADAERWSFRQRPPPGRSKRRSKATSRNRSAIRPPALPGSGFEAVEIAARRQALRLAAPSAGTEAQRRHHRSCSADGDVFADTWSAGHDRQHGGPGREGCGAA
jgi:hypothetical protein